MTNLMGSLIKHAEQYECSIIQYPSGRFGYVGTVPNELCEKKVNKIGQEYFASKTFDTRSQAETALSNLEKIYRDKYVIKAVNNFDVLLEACRSASTILDECGPANNLPEGKKIFWRNTLKKLNEAINQASK